MQAMVPRTAVVVLIATIVGGASAIGATVPQRGPQDQWVNPGIGPGSSSDLAKFVASTDGAFIGVLESMSTDFADESQQWLFTSLHFRVTEWLYNKPDRPHADTVGVLAYGGTFTERGNRRVPTGPADIARHLRVGAEYFVPIIYAGRPDYPWHGQPLLAASDALTELGDRDVAAVQPQSRWAAIVVAATSGTEPTPGSTGDDRQRFIAAIRTAATRN